MPNTIIDIQKLCKSYTNTPVLHDITTQVSSGEVIGLVGLNGAGKTTLLETMLGLNTVDEGAIKLFGAASDELDAHGIKAKIGFVAQSDELLQGLTGQRYLDLVASFYPTWDAEHVARLTQEWDIPVDREIAKLSVGQRQKLAIVSSLGHLPELLILDEPVASLDPVARRQFLAELVSIAHDRQVTIIFSTHIVTDLERVADRLWLLKDGQLTIDAPLDELKEQHDLNLEDLFFEEHA